MMNSLLTWLRGRNPGTNALDHVLPRMVARLGPDFAVFADCGAGVGHTGKSYARILNDNLPEADRPKARVFCYEPLPENLPSLHKALDPVPAAVIRPVAVGDKVTKASFVVPRRIVSTSSHGWTAGTSALGFLGKSGDAETIEVDVVPLRDEPVARFDFVKLDLQGGERAAIRGLGDKLDQVKLIYAEHQMLGKPEYGPLSMLQDAGFLCFFDKVQFGVRLATRELPLALLRDIGLTVERIVPPDGSGMSRDYMLTGYLDDAAGALPASGIFPTETIARLKEAGIYYLQTDVLAVNPRIYRDFLYAL